MSYNANQRVREYKNTHKRRGVWKRIVAALGCVVVFCTTYALILPAITEDRAAYCGAEEHTHSIEQGCYEKVLICGCADTAETEPADGNAAAGKTAIPTETENVPDAGTEPAHVHTEECYEYRLVCQLTEHTHSTACFSNPEADVETAEDWEKDFEKVELNGNYAEDLLAIARTQIGYTESEKNYLVTTNDAGEEVLKGYTRYGAWYGMPYEDWCAMFVSFCLNYAEVPTEVFPQSAGCETWIEVLEEKGLYLTAAEYESEENGGPYEGDIVFFDWNADGSADHVGIVSELLYDENDGKTLIGFKTIEGNSNNQVQKVTYGFSSADIMGYGVMPYESEKGIAPLKADSESELVLKQYLGDAAGLSGTGPYAIYNATRNKVLLTSTVGSDSETKGLGTGDLSLENCIWYFEKTVNTTYNIYYLDSSGTRQYLKLADDGEDNGNFDMSLTNTKNQATDFTIDTNDNNQFVLYRSNGPYIDAYSETKFAGWKGGNQNGFNNNNEVMTLWYGASNKVATISPSSTVINLFDYRVNMDSNDNWDENTGWQDANNRTGINAGHAMTFQSESYAGNGTMNKWTGKDAGVLQGIVSKELSTDGYPILSGNTTITYGNTESLGYLFKTSVSDAESAYKRAYPNVKGLLQLGSDGYYYYDSTKNYAEFDASTNRFTVYDDYAIQYYGNEGEFFPFDPYSEVGKETNAGSGDLNHFFGMHLKTYFVQNYSGYADEGKKTPTTFEFSGDDDVWIFVDDVLVADLGGIHDAASVTIDFAAGTVTISKVYEQNETNIQTTFSDIFAGTGVELATYNDKTTLVNNSSHTLDFFYLERGGNASNLKLKYNLLEIPATSIYKVDQYGNALAGATFAVYGATKQTDGSYLYKDSNGTNVSLTGKTWDYRRFNVGGDLWDIIVTNSDSTTTTIPCKYHGTTDGNGEMIFQGDDGSLLSLEDMAGRFGSSFFILREVDVPDGYRTVSDESWFHIDPNAGVMLCDSTYTSGVWASNNAWITAENELDVATEYNLVAAALGLTPNTENGNTTYSIPYVTTNDGTTTSSGTLFAVVLKRNGRDFSRGFGYNFWYPVYGSDAKGYWVVGDDADEPQVPTEPTTDADWGNISFTNCPVNVTAAIEAAKKQAEISGGDDAVIFTPVASGTTTSYKLLMENLPGKIDRYFTYMLNTALAENENNYDAAVAAVKTADAASGGTDPQYTIAYYWTSGTLANATAENTVRVYSHDGLTEGNFSTEWGTTIEIPNMENRLFFQKRDEGKSTSQTAGLLNGAVFALYPAIDAAQIIEGTASGNHLNYYVGDDENDSTVYIIPYPDEPEKVAVFGYTGGTLGLLGSGTYTIQTDDIEFNHTNGFVNNADGTAGVITVTLTADASGNEITNGAQYFIRPVKNAAGETMVGVTHSTCDYNNEAGTGHFTKLPEGEYLLREIYAPSGYEVNTTDIPVLVNEIGVYANAGTDTDGVSVGNGIGYLSKTIDVFASLNEIDESLAWVCGALLRSDATGFTAFDNVTHDVIHVAETDWQFVTQVTGDPTGYGSGKSKNREDAMVSYFEYNGALSDTGKPVIYDYTPNDDTGGQNARPAAGSAPGTLAGQGTYRLWTKTGWSDLAIYQDYAYGQSKTLNTTYYEDLTANGNLSNLFSSSTFVQVTDTRSAVDLVVKKVAANEDGTATDTVLSGAQFRIRREVTETSSDADGNQVTTTDKAWYRYDADAESTVWEPEENDATIVETGADGLAHFHDLAPTSTVRYFLEELKAPAGYVTVEEIEFTVTQEGSTEDGYMPTMNMVTNGYTLSAPDDSSGTRVYTLTVPNRLDPTKYYAQVNLDLTKVAQNGTTPLSGAEFQLYRMEGETRQYYAYDATGGTTWGEQSAAITLTSDANGRVQTFIGLNDIVTEPEGSTTYYLVETRAPEGYNLLTEPIRIDVDITDGTNADPVVAVSVSVGDKTIYSTNGNVTNGADGYSVTAADPTTGEAVNNVITVTYPYTITVPNSTGYELPHTGGPGTIILALPGLALAAFAGCGLVWRKKRGGGA